MSIEVIAFLSAEIVLVIVALGIYLGGAFAPSKPWGPVALAGLVLSAVTLYYCGGNERFMDARIRTSMKADVAQITSAAVAKDISEYVVNSPVVTDPFASFGRWLALAFGAVMVLLAMRPLATGGTPEYVGSLLLTVAGLMLVSSAGNLVLLFVGLELISIPTYILLSLGRVDSASKESAAKYFFLSVLASAILLYGFSFLYGTAGSMQLEVIRSKLFHPELLPRGFDSLVKIAMVLVIAGLCFRVTAVPFHFYAPDVYQGTIHANAGLLSVLPKAAGLIALVRIVLVAMPPDMEPSAWKVTLGLSIVTMTLGNVMALWQDNVRRLFAYSSIANAGYMLIGLTVGLAVPHSSSLWDGVGAMLFFLCAYSAATLGLFAAMAYLSREKQQIESIDELAGLGRTHPMIAAAIAACMFSLAGLPPSGGLWGKLLLFGSALNVKSDGQPLRPWFLALAVIGVMNAAIAAYYYLRIVSVMYFRSPLATLRAEGGGGPWIATMGCTVVVLALFLYPAPLIRAANAVSPTAMHHDSEDNPVARTETIERPVPLIQPPSKSPIGVGMSSLAESKLRPDALRTSSSLR